MTSDHFDQLEECVGVLGTIELKEKRARVKGIRGKAWCERRRYLLSSPD